MNAHRSTLLLIIIIALFAACVPARKYEEMNTRYKSAQETEAAALAKQQQAEATMKEKQAQMDDLAARNEHLQRDTLTMGTSLRHMTTQYDKINKLNDELLKLTF